MNNINIEQLVTVKPMSECIKEGKKIQKEMEALLIYNEERDILLVKGALSPHFIPMEEIRDRGHLLDWAYALTGRSWITRDLLGVIIERIAMIKGITLNEVGL